MPRYEWALALPFLAAFLLALWGTAVVTFSEPARLIAGERPRAPRLARAGVAMGVLAFVARRWASFRWLALLVALLASFEAFNFFGILVRLPIRTTRGWWRALALTDTLISRGARRCSSRGSSQSSCCGATHVSCAG